jgi:hypothetical protein
MDPSAEESDPSTTVAHRRNRRRAVVFVVEIVVVIGSAMAIAVAVHDRFAPTTHTTAVLTVTERMSNVSSTGPAPFTITTRHPVVSGLTDTALAIRINAALDAPVTRAIDEFTKRFTAHVVPETGTSLDLVDNVYLVGKLISVRYDLRWHYADAGSRNLETTAVTVRTDTGDAIPVQNMLSAHGRDAAGLTRITTGLQAQRAIATCDDRDSGGYGVESLTQALRNPAEQSTPDTAAVVLNWTPAGVRFSFGGGVIAASACGIPSGVLTIAALGDLLDPATTALTGAR